jgi:hypothetical protein
MDPIIECPVFGGSGVELTLNPQSIEITAWISVSKSGF